MASEDDTSDQTRVVVQHPGDTADRGSELTDTFSSRPTALRVLLVVAGTICVVLAAIGVVLPMLPTTPFLLLAAACYLRSSERLYRWVHANRLFGPYLTNYAKRQMRRRDRMVTLIIMWVGMSILLLFVPLLAVQVLLVLIAAGVTIHLCRLKGID